MSWYLKKISGEVFGPVELAALETWATDGRVAPDDQLSQDQVSWIPAPERPELGMDWIGELDGGATYGPLHLFSLRDLLQDGSISRRSRITNRQSGEASTVGDVLMPVLMARDVKLQSTVDSLAKRLEEAEQRAAKAAGKGEGAREAQLRHELELATRMKDDFQHKMQKWESLYATEEANSRKREQQLQQEIQALKAAAGGAPAPAAADGQALKQQLEEERAAARAREAQLQEEGAALKRSPRKGGPKATGDLQHQAEKWKKLYDEEQASARERENRLREELQTAKLSANQQGDLQDQVAKWKKLYEQLRDAVKAEKSKNREALTQPQSGDLVPRALLEETEHKLTQVEQSYRHLMRTFNRNLSPAPRGQPSSSPDNLRRRDVN